MITIQFRLLNSHSNMISRLLLFSLQNVKIILVVFFLIEKKKKNPLQESAHYSDKALLSQRYLRSDKALERKRFFVFKIQENIVALRKLQVVCYQLIRVVFSAKLLRIKFP